MQIDLNLFKSEMRSKKISIPEKMPLNVTGEDPEKISTITNKTPSPFGLLQKDLELQI